MTAEDRAVIQAYRSGSKRAIYSTNFRSTEELQAHWGLIADDNKNGDFLSCRRPGNVEGTPAGLRLKTLVVSDCYHHWSTGYIVGKAQYPFGFFEATMKIADISSMNNALWLTTEDNDEIDVVEVHYPDYIHFGLQYWPHNKTEKHSGTGWGGYFVDNFSQGFHDFGLLGSPEELIYEVDGEPIAAAVVRISTALLAGAGKMPDHPEGHDVMVKSLRIFAP